MAVGKVGHICLRAELETRQVPSDHWTVAFVILDEPADHSEAFDQVLNLRDE